MSILVTGGAGFIGSCFVRMLLSGAFPSYAGVEVTVLDKFTYSGNRANLEVVAGFPQLTVVEGDICDAGLVDRLLPGHDAVVHFAAQTHVDRAVSDAMPFVQPNVVGTQCPLDGVTRSSRCRRGDGRVGAR